MKKLDFLMELAKLDHLEGAGGPHVLQMVVSRHYGEVSFFDSKGKLKPEHTKQKVRLALEIIETAWGRAGMTVRELQSLDRGRASDIETGRFPHASTNPPKNNC